LQQLGIDKSVTVRSQPLNSASVKPEISWKRRCCSQRKFVQYTIFTGVQACPSSHQLLLRKLARADSLELGNLQSIKQKPQAQNTRPQQLSSPLR